MVQPAQIVLYFVCSTREVEERARSVVKHVLQVDDIWGGLNSIRFLADELDESDLLAVSSARDDEQTDRVIVQANASDLRIICR